MDKREDREEIKDLEINFQNISYYQDYDKDEENIQQDLNQEQQMNPEEYYQYMYYQQCLQQQMYQQQFQNMSLMYYNPIENYFNCVNHQNTFIQNDQNALFFMMKSFNEANILYAIQNGIWCSTFKGNSKLEQYFQMYPFTPIYLFFSINESGSCQGLAQMKSNVNFNVKFPIQNQQNKWKGIFTIEWLYVKTISNEHFRKIKNSLNEGKPFTNSRDCQQISYEAGYRAYCVFKNSKTQQSLLNTLFNNIEYEQQQEQEQEQHDLDN